MRRRGRGWRDAAMSPGTPGTPGAGEAGEPSPGVSAGNLALPRLHFRPLAPGLWEDKPLTQWGLGGQDPTSGRLSSNTN